MTLNLVPASTSDYRRLAKTKLPRNLFDYIDGGAYNETTLQANVEDFQTLKLRQRVMHDVASIDTSVKIFGEDWSMPLALAPIGLAGMMARRAEVQAALAAQTAGLPFCLSTVSICGLEEVAKAVDKPFWFQLYMMRDRGFVQALLERAKRAGCQTLVFTVDLAVVGARYRDVRNGMGGGLSLRGKVRAALEYPLHPQWLLDVAIKGKPHMFGNLTEVLPKAQSLTGFKDWVDAQFDPSCTWKDIEWLRNIWDGNLVIKGVLSAEDAKAAILAGADGVVVSNHGGRQLDGVSSSIHKVADIRHALGDKAVILMDGGVRSGQDIVKAVACGADAALIGRAWIWALAARGQAGLDALLATFKSEMHVSMALTATTKISDLNPDILE
ncbi:MAG TPA: L-lactate dehydrogenase [Hellea balneolensis]|uniref:L-lactate dehydrogenase n=1 Tax=Hellea balneolensis TaxID=287478 RepID=A0A7C5LZA9_9PROT|nr:L-lactate dehydrogenase [Hellea balneolensis]